MAQTTVTLSSGQKVPSIGFGTWELLPRSVAKESVRAAITAGYRLFDTARIYENEEAVGQAIRESSKARTEFFITTKLWNDDQGYDTTVGACNASLRRLGMDYVDLYLIHWPATSRRNESWRALIELQKQGKVRNIGVSNYTVRHLRELMDVSEVVPMVDQVELHPFIYEQQRELLDFCSRYNILVEAYSPLSRTIHKVHPIIQSIAHQLGKMPSQVVLRWCMQHGTVPLPRSRNPEHIQSNLDVFDFELDDGAMRLLDSLSDGERVTWDPAGMR
jgi:diketogulonate reductase-like aldo/keto reductase